VITETFRYVSPADAHGIADALAGGEPGAVVLGGGTMLVPEMTHGRTRPRLVVDVARASMSYVREEDDGLHVGGATTYSDLLASPVAQSAAPLLYRLSTGITGGPQIRNRGTIGGSASYANPSSDVPAALVASRARLRLLSASGVREVDASQHVTGAFTTVRRPDEVLFEAVLPSMPPGTRMGYVKLKLSESSWPIATAAAVVTDGEPVRVALGGVADRPLLVDVDPPPPQDGGAWRQHVQDVVHAALTVPWSDVLADGEYRRQVAPVVAVRAVTQAIRSGSRSA
jgi:aerobic carbon-monoxide dehydrogenase medium subunit